MTEREKPPEYMNIPDDLHEYFISHGWHTNYWLEIPVRWYEWDTCQLKNYPITKVIYDWKRTHKA